MGQPLPADPPPRLQPASSPSVPGPPTSWSSSPEPGPQTPSPPTTRSRLPHHQRFNSPTYGLDPEVVALLGRPRRDERSPSPATPSSRFVSPPRSSFDSPAAEASTAWDRWLNERSTYRRAQPLSVPSADLAGSLSRMRDSAERLREAEQRVALQTASATARMESAPTSRLPDTLTNFADSLEEPRRALEQVRQRLDETRQRVAAVAASTRRREVELDEAAERARAQARDSLDRTVDFASRLDHLANTLNSIAQRASALSPALEPLRQPARPANLVTSPAELEPPSLAAQTDSIRTTVRQLMLASRRVSSAVDRHRELAVGASSSSAAAASPPAPALDEPMRVVVLSSASSADPLARHPDTSPNPSGLLLPPSTLFTTSPASLSPSPSSPSGTASPRASTSFPPPLPPTPSPPDRENYPGERAQLLRIAALQADIAARAGELRTLRERDREVDRERRALEGAEMSLVEGGAGALEDKEDEEGAAGGLLLRGGAPLARAERVPLLLAGRTGRLLAEQAGEGLDGGGGGGRKRARTAEELRREYELYRVCGR
ncbi:hypothetical protein JCM9279_006742 [Rhodotorula babjevae]